MAQAHPCENVRSAALEPQHRRCGGRGQPVTRASAREGQEQQGQRIKGQCVHPRAPGVHPGPGDREEARQALAQA